MDQMEQSELLDPLSEILALAEEEKKRRGLFYISREIAQQPETWERLARFASIAPRTSADSSNRPALATARERHPR